MLDWERAPAGAHAPAAGRDETAAAAVAPPPRRIAFNALLTLALMVALVAGVLPIVTEAAQAYGITPVEMARASLVGQPVHLLSPLVPSTYLLVGLAGVDFGDHQRFTLRWAALTCLVMLLAALAFGVFPLARG